MSILLKQVQYINKFRKQVLYNARSAIGSRYDPDKY